MPDESRGSPVAELSRRSALRMFGAGMVQVAHVARTVDEDDRWGQYNVGVGSKTARADVLDLARRVLHRFAFPTLTVELKRDTATRLGEWPGIRYVEPDVTYQALDGSCGPRTATGPRTGTTDDSGVVDRGDTDDQRVPWGVDRVGARDANEAGYTGNGADVAVVDTGIAASHPDLVDVLGDGEAVVECSGSDCEQPWDDDGGHGTHCAGTVGATESDSGVVGVAPEATLHAVKVLTGAGTGSSSDIADGIERVADNGWDVASLSLGSPRPSRAVREACTYARERGVLVIAAAGNRGPCSDCVSYPAAYEDVVGVSATTEGDELARFSSTGPEVGLAAPGEDVESTYPGGYERLSGTSMACPHVAGTAALLMAEGLDDGATAIALEETAEDVGLAPEEGGAGLVSAAGAVDTNL
jgi:subtilisin